MAKNSDDDLPSAVDLWSDHIEQMEENVNEWKRGIWIWEGVERESQSIRRRQNGDLEGEKGAEIHRSETSTPKIIKSTKTCPSILQIPSKLMPSARAKQRITTTSSSHRQNRSDVGKSSTSLDVGSRMKSGENGPEDHFVKDLIEMKECLRGGGLRPQQLVPGALCQVTLDFITEV
ncbi:uncharacterized protein EI90DRAFT_3118740 [Cantharellus anzutake]|uniref:uncharacterized protein n=1 Tax=Cantharellus anzutake TaxID=1750568 RepID=UPI001905C9CA|nr:uncharacterized protein EI90DRAFT_3118740 [Cantharellus anzutake]KAF8337315.1 hypothetical protein EI90DRAFT_3118740 [Cantharellus anzutake]